MVILLRTERWFDINELCEHVLQWLGQKANIWKIDHLDPFGKILI